MKKQVKLAKIVNKLDEETTNLLKEQLVSSGIDLGDCEVLRKSFESNDNIECKVKLDEGSRTAVKYISTRTVDSAGDIILPKGMNFQLFRKAGMPVFYGHDYSKPQIARAEKISADEWGVKATVRYADTGEGTLADVLWRLTAQDMNKQSSVGIIPTEVIRSGEPDFDKAVKILSSQYPELKKTKKSLRRIISKCILFEFSDVSLACNTDTEVLAVSKMYQDAGADPTLMKQLGFHVEEDALETIEALEQDVDTINPKNTPIDPIEVAVDDIVEPVVEKKVERKVTLVKEPYMVKVIALPPVKLDKDEIKSAISDEVRKRLGRIF